MRNKLGLNDYQVSTSRNKYGSNLIVRKARFSPLRLLLSQFVSPVMLVLVIAGIISYVLHGVTDAIVIWGAVILNGLLGFYQEYRAEKSLSSLEKIVEVLVDVVRNGKRVNTPLSEIVVGDICYLKSGDKVPGDALILESSALSINESMLTGESSAVVKNGNDAKVYMGTSVVSGLATIEIVKVGDKTKMGQIALSLADTQRTPTRLQVELASFAKTITWVVVGVAAALFVVGMISGMEIREMFLVSVAVAVSAIPEGLAVTLTVILSVGMQKLLKRKGLVRKLLVAETLGKVSVVCVDKTGTLTTGEVSVVKVEGEMEKLLAAAILANDSADPIETAIHKWARQKCEMPNWRRTATIPFDSHKKYGANASSNKNETRMILRGAPEVVLQHCRMARDKKAGLIKGIMALASQGNRIVAVAEYRTKSVSDDAASQLYQIINENKWDYIGIMVMEDPVRINVKDELAKLENLGIRFCLITGDFAQTAQYVLKKLEIEVGDKVITGDEFRSLSPSQQNKTVKETALFARFAPEDKLKVVEILKEQGEVVAMIGDGINDAPALKRADVGIVVSSASEVAKETADMILLDNHFGTVIAGIEEGRSIFERIRRVVRYLLSDSFDEVIVVSVAILIGLPLPVSAVQILWINLANDSFPAIALAFDPVDPKTRIKNKGFWDIESKSLVAVVSIVSGLLVLAMFAWSLSTGHEATYARSLTFSFLGINTLFCVFVMRSFRVPLWRTKIFDNFYLLCGVVIGIIMQVLAIYLPPLQKILGTVALSAQDWGIIAMGTVIVVLSIEIVKLGLARLVQQPNAQIE